MHTSQKTKKGVLFGVFVFFPLILAALLLPTVTHGQSLATVFTCTVAPWWCALNGLTLIFMGFAAGLMGISGVVLNIAFFATVENFRVLIDNIGTIAFAWTLVRDVVNVVFIFVILFIGISIILQLQNQFSRKLLVRVIIAALLINFSFFMTRVVIDASNILTFYFYAPIAEIDPKEVNLPFSGTTLDFAAGALEKTGLAGAFFNAVGLSIYSSGDFKAAFDNDTIVSQFFASIFFLVAAFIFFAIALMFFARFIILIFLLVTSPIAFVGGLLPALSKHATKWWNTLTDQALWPPIFMLLATIAYVIVSDKSFQALLDPRNETTPLTQNGVPLGNFITLTVSFIVVMGFLVMALVAAKQAASRTAGSAVKWATQTAGKVTLGSTAWATRNTLGRGAKALADSGALKAATQQRGVTGLAARGLLRLGDTYQKRALDLRSTGILGKVDAGSVQKGGFKKEFDERVKLDKERKQAAGVYEAKQQVKQDRRVAAQKLRDKIARLEEGVRLGEPSDTSGARRQAIERQQQVIKELKKELAQAEEKPETVAEAQKEVAETIKAVGNREVLEIKRLIKLLEDKNTSTPEKRRARDALARKSAPEQQYASALQQLTKIQAEQREAVGIMTQAVAERGLDHWLPELAESARQVRDGKTNKDKLVDAAQALAEEVKKGDTQETSTGSGKAKKKGSDAEEGVE